MDKTEAKILREAIQAAIEPILAEHGMKLGTCNAKFDDSSFNLTIKSADPDAPIGKWELTGVGLPEDLKAGLEFDYANKRYRFTGVNTRRPKFPISATDLATGKQYKLPRQAGIAITEAHEKGE